MAASHGAKQSMEILVQRGADINAQDNRQSTALHALVLKRFDVLALWLIRQGANITLVDNKRFSPVDLALDWFQKEMKEAAEAFKKGLVDAGERNLTGGGRREGAPDEVLKIFLEGKETFHSVKVSANHTATDICQLITVEKLSMAQALPFVEMTELIKGAKKRMQPNALLLMKKQAWPKIMGPTGNETHIHCRFQIGLKDTAPDDIKKLFATK